MVDKNRSSRTWVGDDIDGETVGHLPLPEARRWAVGKLEEAEAVLQARDEALAVVQGEFRAALAARDRAYNARQEAHAAVKRWQKDVAYRMSTDTLVSMS